jgi:WD40 repeat protein
MKFKSNYFLINKLFLIFFFFSFMIHSLSAEKVLSEFTFSSQFDSLPTFYEADSPFFVNSGKWIYIGKTADFDEIGVYFYNTESKEKLFKAIPIEEYYLSNSQKFIGKLESTGKKFPISLQQFLFYDEATQRAGFILENRHSSEKVRKYFFAGWNLKSNSIDILEEIKINLDSKPFSIGFALDYSSNQQTGYFLIATDADLDNGLVDDVEVKIYKFNSTQVSMIHQYNSKFLPYNPIYHEQSNQIAIASYSENYQKLNPIGYLYKIETNELNVFPIPSTPYGICFTKNGDSLYIASSDTGEVRRYNTKNTKEFLKSKWGIQGHTLGFWNDSELLWVRNSGIHIYDPITLKQKKIISTKKFFKGQINVSGSRINPFQKLLLRNILENPTGGAANRLISSE